MQGHLPVPPHSPPPPQIAGPVIGYLAMRERQPLEERASAEPDWWDDEVEACGPSHPPLVRVTAAVLSLCLVVAGFGTVLELILTSR